MKYTIEGFSQSEALNFRKEVEENGKIKTIKLDCVDLVILRWFVDFYPNMMKVEINGAQYAWIDYKYLLEDMPILDIKKQMLALRLKKMVDFGILTNNTIKAGGTFSYYGFGKNYNKLINTVKNEEGKEKNSEGSIINYKGVDNKLDRGIKNNIDQINTSTKDTSTNISSIKDNIVLSTIRLYNEICVDFPRAMENDTLSNLILRNQDYDYKTLFEIAQRSDFLSGRNEKFKANLEWLLRNRQKVMSGFYDDKKKPEKPKKDIPSYGDLSITGDVSIPDGWDPVNKCWRNNK